jgi:hypothetical protein
MIFFAGALGGLVANNMFVDTKGEKGICVAFKAAISIIRRVFVSPQFMAANVNFCQDLLEVLKLADCKWQLLRRDELDKEIQRLNPSRARQLIIFHAPAEHGFPQNVHCFSALDAAVGDPVICTVDQSRSRSGICSSHTRKYQGRNFQGITWKCL